MAFKYRVRKPETMTGYAELQKRYESGEQLGSEEFQKLRNAGRTTEYDFPGREELIKKIKDIKVDEE